MINLYAVILTLIISVSIFASPDQSNRDGKIKGKIQDKALNKPIEYANVVLYNKIDSSLITGTITNQDGEFLIEKIPYGEYYIVADFLGYKETIISDLKLTKKINEISLKEILLEQAVNQIKDVEVVADRNYVDYKIDKKVVNVGQHINASGGSAADVLENIPSVSVDVEGNVSLRGSSSFTVLIDGKPSVIPGNEVLKQLSANTIENIEIITNPSAKYDPDGTTGIINIIMKKEKQEGFNGFINTTVATWNKFGGSINLNQRNKKNNFFLNANYNRSPRDMVAWENRTNMMNDTTMHLEEYSERVQTFRPWDINLGIDHYINNNNILTLSGSVGSFGFFRDFETTYHSYTDAGNDDEYIYSHHNFNTDGIYYTANANLQHNFTDKGHKIDFSISAWQWQGDQNETSNEVFADAAWNPTSNTIKSRFIHNSIRNNLRIKTDYTLPTKNGKMEVGLLTHLNPGTSDYIFENFDPDNETWINNNLFTNKMDFKRNLYSAYATYSSKCKLFGYQFGLRTEYTDRLVNQKTTNEQYPVQIFNYYPTLHLAKDLPKNQQIQVGYSRRINRPQPWELNPFPNYSDSYNFSKGNPNLKPEDIDAVEINYINRVKKGLISAGFYYRLTHNLKVMNINIDEQNRLFLYSENLAESHALGTELMTNFDLNKWLAVNISGNLYRYEINGSLTGNNVDKNSMNWDTRLTSTFKLSKTFRLQINGTYSSPSVEAIGTRQENYFAGIAFRKDILKRRATIAFNVRDIFGTSEYRIRTNRDDYTSEISFKGEAPVFRFSFSYRINNYQRRQQENIDLGVGAG